MNIDLSDDDCDYVGVLRDEEIRKAIAKDILLVRSTTDDERVRQASYELRLSDVAEFLVLPEAAAAGRVEAKYERPANGIGQILKIEPGQTVKVLTKEEFDLPTNVVAHITPVGNIYKLGLSPETTYADPGFDGEFYIVICNYSSRVVELQVGQPIARVEFVRRARSTTKPHPGSRKVTEPALWPRRVDRRDSEALRQLGIDNLLTELDKKDPPHAEHSFIAREVREKVNQGIIEVSARLAILERQASWSRLIAYAIGVVVVLRIVGEIWSWLPPNIQGKIAEGAAKEIIGILLILVPLLFKGVRKTIGLALGRHS